MRNTMLVGVILCLALSSTLATGVVEAFIEKAAETPFGRTLIETIELELQSDAPGDRFFKMLGAMKESQEKDLQALINSNKVYQDNCKRDLTLIKQEIKNSARIVVDSKKAIKREAYDRAWAENQRESNQRQLNEAVGNWKKIKGIRQAEEKEFKQKTSELNAAITTLQTGKFEIERDLKSKAALIQISNSFQSYVERMSRIITTAEYRGRGYVSVVSYIGELLQKAAVQANQNSVQRVLKAIQEIIDQLQNTKTFETNAENERAQNFAALKAIYKESITALRNSLSAFSARIERHTKQISLKMDDIRKHTKMIRLKGRQKRKKTNECQIALRSFQKESKRRQHQLSIVNEAIALINENKAEFRRIVLQNAKGAIDARYGKK